MKGKAIFNSAVGRHGYLRRCDEKEYSPIRKGEVGEEKFTMSQVEDAAEEGRSPEAFTAGTAVYPASFPEKQGL